MKRLGSLLAVMVVVLLLSAPGGANGELSGRDFVALGELKTLAGILETDDDEWFLQTESDLFEIHLGDHGYREGIGMELTAGQEAVVFGYVYGIDVAVVTLTTGSETFALRTETGSPLWAGLHRDARIAAAAGFVGVTAFGDEELDSGEWESAAPGTGFAAGFGDGEYAAPEGLERTDTLSRQTEEAVGGRVRVDWDGETPFAPPPLDPGDEGFMRSQSTAPAAGLAGGGRFRAPATTLLDMYRDGVTPQREHAAEETGQVPGDADENAADTADPDQGEQ